MPQPVEVKIGDVVRLRKKHPSGGDLWKVIRLGSDVVLQNIEADRRITLSRSKFNKSVKRVTSQADEISKDE